MAQHKRRPPNRRRSALVMITTGAALILLCLTGCGGGGSTTAAANSGVNGLAQITRTGGTVPLGKPPPPPTPMPLAQATISVQPAGGGQEIARSATDAQGHFQFTLPPGAYRVVPVLSHSDQLAGVSASSETVAVSAGVFTNLVVDYSQSLP